MRVFFLRLPHNLEDVTLNRKITKVDPLKVGDLVSYVLRGKETTKLYPVKSIDENGNITLTNDEYGNDLMLKHSQRQTGYYHFDTKLDSVENHISINRINTVIMNGEKVPLTDPRTCFLT